MFHHGRASSCWCLVVCSHFHERVGEVSVAGESRILHEVAQHTTWQVLGGVGGRGVCFLPLLEVFLGERQQILQAVLALPCLVIRCLGRRNVPLLQPRSEVVLMLLIGET